MNSEKTETKMDQIKQARKQKKKPVDWNLRKFWFSWSEIFETHKRYFHDHLLPLRQRYKKLMLDQYFIKREKTHLNSSSGFDLILYVYANI